MSMQTAVVYIRVSTDRQADEGVSLDAQTAKAQAWCMVNDYEIIGTECDAGISGGRADNRPGLQAAIEKACKTKSALVVYSLSRLARSTKDTLEIGEKLDRAGADLVSLSEKIDTTSAAGKMIFRMLAVLAEFEKDQVSERTKMALAHKKSKGERVGEVPFGFDLSADGTSLTPNTQEQEALVIIKQLRKEGLTLRAIADELEARQIASKKGHKWNHGTISKILKAA